MRATKKQKAAIAALFDVVAEAQRLLMEVGPCREAAYYVALHAAETLGEQADRLRIAALTPEEYEHELNIEELAEDVEAALLAKKDENGGDE